MKHEFKMHPDFPLDRPETREEVLALLDKYFPDITDEIDLTELDMRYRKSLLNQTIGYDNKGDMFKYSSIKDYYDFESGTSSWKKAIFNYRKEKAKMKQSNAFNLKTDPWYIRANTKDKVIAARNWLHEQGILRFGGETCLLPTSAYLTNRMYDDRQIDGFIMTPYGDSTVSLIAKEIKLTYETAVTDVDYPSKQTPEQKEAESIRKELVKLSQRLKELEG